MAAPPYRTILSRSAGKWELRRIRKDSIMKSKGIETDDAGMDGHQVAFAVFSADDGSLNFYKRAEVP